MVRIPSYECGYKDQTAGGESDANPQCLERPIPKIMIWLLQHGEDESAGTILEYLTEKKISFEICRVYKGDQIPPDIPDSLIVLGGQMSVNDEREYPWLVPEKIFLKKTIAAGRTVLGICLGAQMIASAFGKPVRKGIQEIGWYRIQGCTPEWNSVFPDDFSIFHWHLETFDLPEGATLIARGSDVKNQGFRFGSAVGVQFHPEVTMQIISRWAKNLPPGTQSRILEDSKMYLDENKRRCYALMDAFVRGFQT